MSLRGGKLIVLDGTDGAGKTTQINLLSGWLKKKNIPYEVISFPRYGQNKYARLVKKYLAGEYGSIQKADPYKIAKYYAGDRLLAKSLINSWLKEGKVVLANRYVSSNKAHMGANLPAKEREKFFKWLDKLEYETNSIPKEDLTILLVVDPQVGQSNVLGKQKPDLHEASLEHLKQANKIYLQLAKSEPNWVVVNCMKDGKMRPKEDIHRECIQQLKSSFMQLRS